MTKKQSERFWVKLDRNNIYREWESRNNEEKLEYFGGLFKHLFLGVGDNKLASEMLKESEISHRKAQENGKKGGFTKNNKSSNASSEASSKASSEASSKASSKGGSENPTNNSYSYSNSKRTVTEQNNNTLSRLTPPSVFPFESFWTTYSKKTGRAKTEKKYKQITEDQRSKIKDTLIDYIKSTPEVKYRKDPMTYLNGKCWEDEILSKPIDSPFSDYEDVFHG
jgi:hypothetical protein